MTSSEVLHPGSSFSLPTFRRAGWRWTVSGCSCVASRGFSSPPARLGPAGGLEEPLVACSVHASSLLSLRFIRGLGLQELLSCGGLLLPFCPGWLSLFISARSAGESSGSFSLFSVASPTSSLHARRGGEAGEASECRSS